MSRLLVFTDPAMARHDPGPGMPERSARWLAAHEAIEARRDVELRRPTPIDRDALLRVHDETYVDGLLGAAGRPFAVDPETTGSADSVEAIRLAAGATREAALAAVDGTPAFALVRPPGHHATHRTGMGFCFVNNVVVAARAAQAERAIERVLIVDWDVHHGNGTEDLVKGDASLLFFSTHQGGGGFYPGTGLVSTDNAINVPLGPGDGDAALLDAFRERLRPAAAAFDPDLVLVSAGFDAHEADPLAGMLATADGFAALCTEVRDLADAHADGRLALTLEGGYDLDALTACISACVDVLTH